MNCLKKVKFFTKNKFWLLSFGLATTSSLVLAACASEVESETNFQNENGAGQNNQPQNPDSSVHHPNQPRPLIHRASAEQHELAVATLNQPNVQINLQQAITNAQIEIADQLKNLTAIKDINKSSVNGAINSIVSVSGLVEGLKKLTSANIAVLGVETARSVGELLDQLNQSIQHLTEALNNLPTSVDTSKLDGQHVLFQSRVVSFTRSDNSNLSERLEMLLASRNNYQAALNELSAPFVQVAQNALTLENNLINLETFITTQAPSLNQPNNSQISLQTLAQHLRQQVLGSLDSNPVQSPAQQIHQTKQADVTTVQTNNGQVSLITKVLIQQQGNWNKLETALKQLTFNQSLLVNDPDALNLLALNLDEAVAVTPLNVDLSRQKIQLDQAIVDANNQLLHNLEAIQKTIDFYRQNFITSISGNSKFLNDLEQLQNLVNADNHLKSHVSAISGMIEPSKKLVAALTSFTHLWQEQVSDFVAVNSQDNFPNNTLLADAQNIVDQLVTAQTYSQAFEVAGNIDALNTKVARINAALASKLSGSLTGLLDQIIAMIDDQAELGIALEAYANFANYLSANNNVVRLKYLSIYDKRKRTNQNKGFSFSGYVGQFTHGWSDVVRPYDLSILSVKELRDELVKLTRNNTSSPFTIFLQTIDLPSLTKISNQAQTLNTHLAEVFNNREIIADDY
ncbi:hypothetical protein J2Z62_000447 [Mycoplasmoides fastidiosum]|uniref:Uncharacterized protein n=1 Tax=Mycoplasmoides fastidiosum TaxID=92758 RepID=A0ABU0LZ78_9BACT|nr:hypothetical protein [Mycoplasmoides fastidiosum]MDQ0514009.1 hypothetical protein [Mycoplasmoides fastidiosum]UUD37579.1 hypothetical protein NPA10_03360 [Mycoplasmoides fastidiosum]